ncbi:hypothetical protein FZEAL_4526 [Fusarium zealandicum]|uniref:Uncharacterized protein n=1 Tax=Fusarium zealandicum TaxID=1053134 RepID=A0A8H4ULP2_9HYPO|nr:hypothetical protein FZEAL_4526 [Fusarium zealandicum]
MDIIPVPLTDQQKPIDTIRTRTCFILDKRLDEDTLRSALDNLVRNHWRKLGARLVLRSKDKLLEYHLPKAFDDDYRLFNWSSSEDEKPFKELTSLLDVSAEEGVSLLPPFNKIDGLFTPSNWPTSREDEAPDAPLLYVHLALSSDATVVVTSLPHAVADQYGLSNIMKAWLGLADGRDPPPMVGSDDDPLPKSKPYAEFPKQEVFRKGHMRVRRKGEFFFLVLGFIPDLIVHQKETPHIVFFPRPLIRSLVEQHSNTLREKYGPDVRISEGDIITGILTKVRAYPPTCWRCPADLQAVNLRGRHANLSDGERDGFIHNGLYYSSARFRIDASTPLSEIAYRNRQAINEVLNDKEIDIAMAVTREMVQRKQPSHICEPFDRSYSLSNWCGAWKALDFSSAINAEKERPAAKLLVLGQSFLGNKPHRYHSSVMCKTDEGFYCDFSAPCKAVERMHEYLAKDPLLKDF